VSVRRRAMLLTAAVLLASVASPAAAQGADELRIVTVGAAVTETVHALGAGDSIVGVDTTSQWPETVRQLPSVGYMRALGVEGLLSLRPSLVLCTAEAGPRAVLDQLGSAGTRVEVLPAPASIADAEALVRRVGELLDRQDRSHDVVATLRRQVEEARARLPQGSAPRVLFLVHAPTGAAPLAAGRGTPASAMIELAGGINVAASLEGYKPIGPEAMLAASPQVVVVPAGTVARAGGAKAILQQGALAETPAGRDGRLVEADPYVVAFGPRTGQAIADLGRRIHAPALHASR